MPSNKTFPIKTASQHSEMWGGESSDDEQVLEFFLQFSLSFFVYFKYV